MRGTGNGPIVQILKSEADLWWNLRDKIENRNKSELDGHDFN